MKKIVIYFLIFVLTGLLGFSAFSADTPKTKKGGKLVIKYLGHACFLITAPNGTRILMDPYNDDVGFPVHQVDADIITISHEHFDHNNVSMARGNPVVIRGLESGGTKWASVDKLVKGVKITELHAYHDTSGGKERGLDAIFILDVGGIRIAHLGDLGQPLALDQVRSLRNIDIMMIPVGGYFTIDANEAKKIIKETTPGIVMPMHYKTHYHRPGFPIAAVDTFIQGLSNVVKLPGNELVITKDQIPSQTKVYIFKI